MILAEQTYKTTDARFALNEDNISKSEYERRNLLLRATCTHVLLVFFVVYT